MPKNKEKTHYCGTLLPLSLYRELQHSAAMSGRSISREIMVLIRDGIENKTTKKGKNV